MLRPVLLACAMTMAAGCASAPPPPPPKPPGPPPDMVMKVEYEQKTLELLQATERLTDLRDSFDEQRRRLAIICVDHPEHDVCAEQTAARYARGAFCGDAEFTGHVDGIVSACHEGQCKQVDQASMITRSDYMLLLSRLPSTLVLFRANQTKLDRRDRKQLQTFLENVQGERGYLIIVGRASRDGRWEKNLQLALDRAEETRSYLVDALGTETDRVGYITYGHPKMYLTELDAERMAAGKLSVKQANRSALVFAYPCYEEDPKAKVIDGYGY